jgi:hypothetical protein
MSAPLPSSMPSLHNLRQQILTNLALAIAGAAQRLHGVIAGQTETTPADLRAALALIRLAPKILSELPSDPDCDEDGNCESLADPGTAAGCASAHHSNHTAPPAPPHAETTGIPAQPPEPTPSALRTDISNPKSAVPKPQSQMSDLTSEISNPKSQIPNPPTAPRSTQNTASSAAATPRARCNRCGLIHESAPCPDRRDPRALARAARAEVLARAVARNH